MDKEREELLRRGAGRYGVELDENKIEQFDRFTDLLLEWNQSLNLTRITEPREIIIKHYLDSLSVLQADIPQGAKVIDVGCGAGFPGIPLLMARTDIQVTFLDSLKKRLNFIDSVLPAIGIQKSRFVCLHSRAEDAGRNPLFREHYDIAVARAVSELRVLAEYCLPLLKKGGLLIAMKGPDSQEEIKRAENAVAVLGGKRERIIDFQLEENDLKRKLILVRKEQKTPGGYPRQTAKMEKKPL